MEQSIIRSNRWNEAARYGIILGLIPAAYLYLGHLQIYIGTAGLVTSTITIVAWMAKFAGCIMLMRHVMNKFAYTNPDDTRTDLFKLGALLAVFSALVYSTIAVVDQLYVFPEYYQSIYAIAVEEYSKVLPSEQIEELTGMLANAHKISFFITFIYCALYGTVLSLILSRITPTKNN